METNSYVIAAVSNELSSMVSAGMIGKCEYLGHLELLLLIESNGEDPMSEMYLH